MLSTEIHTNYAKGVLFQLDISPLMQSLKWIRTWVWELACLRLSLLQANTPVLRGQIHAARSGSFRDILYKWFHLRRNKFLFCHQQTEQVSDSWNLFMRFGKTCVIWHNILEVKREWFERHVPVHVCVCVCVCVCVHVPVCVCVLHVRHPAITWLHFSEVTTGVYEPNVCFAGLIFPKKKTLTYSLTLFCSHRKLNATSSDARRESSGRKYQKQQNVTICKILWTFWKYFAVFHNDY